MTNRGWTPPPDPGVRAAGEICFRVPILLNDAAVVTFEGYGSTPENHGFERVVRRSNVQPWGPIISARDADSALAKAKAIYPAAVTGEPYPLHRSRPHANGTAHGPAGAHA